MIKPLLPIKPEEPRRLIEAEDYRDNIVDLQQIEMFNNLQEIIDQIPADIPYDTVKVKACGYYGKNTYHFTYEKPQKMIELTEVEWKIAQSRYKREMKKWAEEMIEYNKQLELWEKLEDMKLLEEVKKKYNLN